MKISNEFKIGIMVSIVAVLLIALTIKAGDFRFSKTGYILKVQFLNIDGVNNNTPVMLNGLEVGYVKETHVFFYRKKIQKRR